MKSYRSYRSHRSYKVQNRPRFRSSSFLGVNVGLDPVQNLSKSGLKPDYDDQESKIEWNQNRIKIMVEILMEILGNPNRKNRESPRKAQLKSKEIHDRS